MRDFFPELLIKEPIIKSRFRSNSMNIGSKSELLFMIECFNRDWEICQPFHHSHPYDFVIRREDKWETVQVKTAYEKIKSGQKSIQFRLRRSRNKGKKIAYSEGDFDLLAVVHKADIWLITWEAVKHIKNEAKIYRTCFDQYRLWSV